jgi:hydantoinase/carbamoylase family amidase
MVIRSGFDLKASARRLEEGIRELSRFSRPGPGVTRLSFTPEYQSALAYLIEEFGALGYETTYDPVGNFIATNVEPSDWCVALGSHVDSVPHGGSFDGTAGVLCALEVARTVPDAPLKVFSFVEEEGSRFGSGILGGRCAVGLVAAEELKSYRDQEGISFYQAAEEAGHRPAQAKECVENLEGVERYVEVHIEQGRVLEESGEEVGIVEAIAGMVHGSLEIEGRADHAGATPMDLRSDAAVTAAELVVELERAVRETDGSTVGTVGRIELYPGALNVIPGRAFVGLDVRDVDTERRDQVLRGVVAFARERAKTRGQQVTYQEHLNTDPVTLDPRVVATLQRATEKVGIPSRRMVSGAGHDAMMIAQRVPTAMLFVPSQNGVSHAPEEYTDPRHLAGAVAVLLETMEETSRLRR